jgi:pheromone a factor receptor
MGLACAWHSCFLSDLCHLKARHTGSAFYNFFKLRLAFKEHLAKHNSALTPSRYFRLMGMALVVIFWNTGLNVYTLILDSRFGMRPWTSWADVHSDWNRTDQYPFVLLPAFYVQNVLVYFYSVPASSFIMFFFFGLGEEARKEYAKVWKWFCRVVLRRKDSGLRGSAAALPRYRCALSKHFHFVF